MSKKQELQEFKIKVGRKVLSIQASEESYYDLLYNTSPEAWLPRIIAWSKLKLDCPECTGTYPREIWIQTTCAHCGFEHSICVHSRKDAVRI
jgi:hypothetical protein